MLLEHAFGLGPSPQIDITDNASNVSCRSVFSGGAFPDHTGDELCLAERLELHRAISAVHCAAFREQSRDNLVTTTHIGAEILKKITVGTVP